MKHKVYEDGLAPGDGDGGELYTFNMGNSYPELSYIINGKNSCYMAIEQEWYLVSNPTDPFKKMEILTDFMPMLMIDGVLYLDNSSKDTEIETVYKKLSLDKVIELSHKRSDLSWHDFEEYSSIDIGSGLYILRYEIDADFYLLIGGISDIKPMYIYLVRMNNRDDYIDIRTDDVESFILDK